MELNFGLLKVEHGPRDVACTARDRESTNLLRSRGESAGVARRPGGKWRPVRLPDLERPLSIGTANGVEDGKLPTCGRDREPVSPGEVPRGPAERGARLRGSRPCAEKKPFY